MINNSSSSCLNLQWFSYMIKGISIYQTRYLTLRWWLMVKICLGDLDSQREKASCWFTCCTRNDMLFDSKVYCMEYSVLLLPLYSLVPFLLFSLTDETPTNNSQLGKPSYFVSLTLLNVIFLFNHIEGKCLICSSILSCYLVMFNVWQELGSTIFTPPFLIALQWVILLHNSTETVWMEWLLTTPPELHLHRWREQEKLIAIKRSMRACYLFEKKL